ncbi:MAG: acetyl-CoA carboxylase biotin carboxylase subunit [Candidatus Aminicenantes bacterium]|nr:acetyl-CoA carboxylase biotin carboxylase subunit [Candidatus Aminicenantes bacterium]
MRTAGKVFDKILVANRGEIAVRIIRACRELGIRSVAVYSEADRAALHCRMADEAVPVGPAPSLESYLNMDRILEAARSTGSQAIHPGYGFLAENSDFCRRCEKEGVVFIGPNSAALELVGDKVRARQAMEKAGVPIIPGMKSAAADDETCVSQAETIGYPVMVKASAGGGGKGMRIVGSEDELRPALEAGRREAKAAFGDDSVYLEKCIEEPRHVEFQVLADNFGKTVHLFERECSIQRRHQKIIEESPSPALDPKLRARMGETARKVMMTAGYNNAGTVEFLLDRDKNFYFLEVNARLQVEHPVTEAVTGVDLVHQQILVASGRKLSLRQEELRQRGHAIECRIYAEDAANRFLPSPGRILFLREPSGPGVRHDCGIFSGWDVPIHYDPILAKLIVWAEDREAACRRMLAALDDYVLLGIRTPIAFLKDVVRHRVFRDGMATTGFIKEHMDGWVEGAKDGEKRRLALAAAAYLALDRKPATRPGAAGAREAYSPWKTIGRWRQGE